MNLKYVNWPFICDFFDSFGFLLYLWFNFVLIIKTLKLIWKGKVLNIEYDIFKN